MNMLASSLSTLVPSLVEMQLKCRGSTSSRPVRAVKLPSAAAQLLTLPFPTTHTHTQCWFQPQTHNGGLKTIRSSVLFDPKVGFLDLSTEIHIKLSCGDDRVLMVTILEIRAFGNTVG